MREDNLNRNPERLRRDVRTVLAAVESAMGRTAEDWRSLEADLFEIYIYMGSPDVIPGDSQPPSDAEFAQLQEGLERLENLLRNPEYESSSWRQSVSAVVQDVTRGLGFRSLSQQRKPTTRR